MTKLEFCSTADHLANHGGRLSFRTNAIGQREIYCMIDGQTIEVIGIVNK